MSSTDAPRRLSLAGTVTMPRAMLVGTLCLVGLLSYGAAALQFARHAPDAGRVTVLATPTQAHSPHPQPTTSVSSTIFLDTAPISVSFRSQGPAGPVNYVVTDQWGNRGTSGQVWAQNGTAVVALPAQADGYYTLQLDDYTDPTVAHQEIPFAVLAPNTPAADSPFAVATHFASNGDPNVASLLPVLGVPSVRDDMTWSRIETTPGKYVFPPRYDSYMATLAHYHISPLIILAYNNPLYDNGNTPYDDAGYQAFTRYALAVVQHYGRQIQVVEVFNEYSNAFFTNGPCGQSGPFGLLRQPDAEGSYAPKPSLVAYAVLLRELSGATIVARENLPGSGSAIIDEHFRQHGTDLRVLWTAGATQGVTVSVSGPVTVTDMMGRSQTLQPDHGTVRLFVSQHPLYLRGAVSAITPRAYIAGEPAPVPAAVDVSAAGPLDWTVWDAAAPASFDHCLSRDTQLSNVIVIGSAAPARSTGGGITLSWSNGAPDAQGTSAGAGVYVGGTRNGFQIAARADTTIRSITLYVGVWRAQGRLTATLSDGSSPPYEDTSLQSQLDYAPGVYVLSYRASMADQVLAITWTTAEEFGHGGVVLQGATLRLPYI